MTHPEPGWVHKPRSVFWEKLFLDQSAFRASITKSCRQAGFEDPFAVCPYLSIQQIHPFEGRCEFFEAAPVTTITAEEAQAVGALAAVLAFFGANDLNAENILVGRDAHGRLRVAPVDLECMGADVHFLSNTLLIPHQSVPESKCGLRTLWSLIRGSRGESGAALIRGLLRTLTHFLTTESFYDELMAHAIGPHRPPIRVLLRKTGSYANYLAGRAKALEFEVPPLASEREQMARGDIPYYFRYPEDPTLRHFVSETETVISDANEMFPPDRFLPQRRLVSPVSPRRGKEQMAIASALQIGRALYTQGDFGESRFQDCRARADGRSFFLMWGDVRVQCPLRPSP